MSILAHFPSYARALVASFVTSPQSSVLKLLLLGAGGSGKSTLFKQMILIYGDGFSQQELESYTPLVHSNTVRVIQTLLRQSKIYAKQDGKYAISAALGDACKRIEVLDTMDDCTVSESLAEDIASVWADSGIRRTFEMRHEYQVQDSAAYFLDRVRAIGRSDYIANEADHLRIRAPTTGVTEQSFTIAGNRFRMFDVGGQRSERKKWIHCFQDVACVLFVANLNGFNQKLYEDSKVNRLDEALALFEDIANNKWFTDTNIILFLNKRDLFVDKIKDHRITECPSLSGFEGDSKSFDETTDFIRDEFLMRNRTKKTVYTHVTCATEKSNVAVVFNSVKDTILKQSLDSAIPGWRDAV